MKKSILSNYGLKNYLLFLFFSTNLFAQLNISTLDTVLVSSIRITDKVPIPFSNMDKEAIEQRNLGQDIPVLMNFLPSVVTTSDAGNGIGYTNIRVRGSDATRINVTVNGIPLNDSESHGVFWVNMPDFASSTGSLQLQRGVGTSTNGAGAFGGSLNMDTETSSNSANARLSSSYGSFNSNKNTFQFGSVLLKNKFELSGRGSIISSDGYIDRAKSDLKSYFLQGIYLGKKSIFKIITFGGNEKTYQAWYGIDSEMLKTNRTYNPAGYFTDDDGSPHFYKNQTDNYQQNHYQLHYTKTINDFWTSNISLHYTIGKGFYEDYKQDENLTDFGFAETKTTDLVVRKWLDNDFYGSTFSLKYKKEKLETILGGAYNQYIGRHFGEIIWSKDNFPINENRIFYDNDGRKNDGNVFLKTDYQLFTRLSIYADVQLRNVHYKANSPEIGLVNDNFIFFNPKVGFTYNLNAKNSFYTSFARANREPNRTDYENGKPKPESLNDYEFGWRYNFRKSKIGANIYFMQYTNQLVLTGALDDVGSPIRSNSGNSYRLGLELEAAFRLGKMWRIIPNMTLSSNKNIDFVSQKDGEIINFGNTNIAFSPKFIAGNTITFFGLPKTEFSLFSKFVGEQYMGNIDSEVSKLKSYFVNDFSVSYNIQPKKIFKALTIKILINNIFDYKYVSNGYFYTYEDTWNNPAKSKTIEESRYYPQSGINFLAGITLSL